ncbi:MAG: DNA translocase FtsK [Bacilli bacterium]|jgi:DNA segregation ATPase FtsK/SpoIIIE-like protein|nr:DNA translocase FtsK [Bacilli bacterium]
MEENKNIDSGSAPLKDSNKTSWYLSSRFTDTVIGFIFVCLGLIGFTAYGWLGGFLAYSLIYVLGLFAYIALVLMVILGLFMIIKGRWPRMRINFTGLGYVLLFIFGALASSLDVEGLSLPSFADKFSTLIAQIAPTAFKVSSITIAGKAGGGFIGYFFASLFLTGLGKIGTIIFAYLFLLAAAILILRIPFMTIYENLSEIAAKKQAKKTLALEEEKKKAAADKTMNPAPTPNAGKANPFKEVAYQGTQEKKDNNIQQPVKPAEVNKPAEKTPTLFGFARKEEPAKPLDSAEKPAPAPYVKSASPFASASFSAELKGEDDTELIKKSAYQDEDAPEDKALSSASPFTSNSFVSPSPLKEEAPAQSVAPKEPVKEEEPASQIQQRTFIVSPAKPVLPPEEKPAVEQAPAPSAPVKPTIEKPAKSIVLDAPEEKPQVKQPEEKIFRYPMPSITLLTQRQDFGKFEQNKRAADEKIPVINGVYQKLGIGAEVESYTIGPSVTRFNIKREPGVRVSQISSPDVESEMKIDLKGDMSVRLEAVVKGQDTSGVEVGNAAPTMVSFFDCFGAVLKKGDDKLLVPLGESISSEVVCVSLDELPHLLIAGTTGSGKSVFIHSIIMTLIMRNYPDELKLILVDPKQVEFTRYSEMPHLYCPIITNISYAVAMLKRLVSEMERRYSILSRYECSNIHDYNKLKKTQTSLENLPNIVCVIDEFADMMGQAPRDVDALTQRLAQKARAAGIYLIISTQRPSVKCITGTIKANIPARVALYLPTNIDSRTILDEGGAEALLGKGDLLARIPSLKATVRLQSAFVSNDEISAVVHYLKAQAAPVYNQAFLNFNPDENQGGEGEGMEGDDEHRSSGFDDDKYAEVKAFVIANNIASTSSIQRRFSLGYGRAASILDALEEEGVIRTVNGNRREVVKEADDGTGINTGE